MHESEPSELTGREPSSHVGCEPSSQAKPPPTAVGVLSSSQVASLHSTVGAAVVGQTGAEPLPVGTGSAPFAQIGSEPSGHTKHWVPREHLEPPSQYSGNWG